MISKWQWLFLQFTRRLWVRAALFAVVGVATALVSSVAENAIPGELPAKIGADAVDHVLDILATSMLAVTTFSLNVMVQSYGMATNNVTPRATRLLIEDTTTQNVLAVFIGSFLFSLVGVVALTTGAYGARGRVVLFIVTIAVIVLIVVTIIRWVDHLSRLGRVGETTRRVEQATTRAIRARAENPNLGGHALGDPQSDVPGSAFAVFPAITGYVQHVDMKALSSFADEREARIFVASMPGSFVHPASPLAWIDGMGVDERDKEKAESAVRFAFTIDHQRSYDQDPRFGLSVLSEIASRALSPALNDPGTAIDVIGRAVRILAIWADRTKPGGGDEILYRRVWMPPIRVGDLFDDVFAPIARDGAGMIEVQIRLHKALLALARLGDAEFKAAAARHSRLAVARGERALVLGEEKEALRELACRFASGSTSDRS